MRRFGGRASVQYVVKCVLCTDGGSALGYTEGLEDEALHRVSWCLQLVSARRGIPD